MKKKFYDVGSFIYMREQKRGVELLVPLAIGTAIASTGASVYSSISNASAIKNANEANRDINQQAIDLQKEQFEESMSFNKSEAQTSREFNSQEAEKNRIFQAGQLDKLMEYQTPSNNLKRYMDAGINPASVVGQLGTIQGFSVPSGAQASSSPATVSAPSVPTLQHMQPETNNLGDVIGNVLGNVNSIYSALSKKEDVKGKITENEFKGILKDLEVQASRGTINKMYRDMRLIDTQIDETLANIEVLQKQLPKMDAEIGKTNAETQYINMEKFYKSQEYEQVIKNLEQKYHLERRQANALIKLYSSQMAANYGAAAQAYANAEYLKAKKELLPDEQRQIQAYERLLNAQEFKTQKEGNRISTQDYLDTFFGYSERQRGMDISAQQLEKARYENTFFFRMLNVGRSVSQDVGDAALMYMVVK